MITKIKRWVIKNTTKNIYLQNGQPSYASYGTIEDAKLYDTETAASTVIKRWLYRRNDKNDKIEPVQIEITFKH